MLIKLVLAYHIHIESFSSTLKPVVLNHEIASSNPAKIGYFSPEEFGKIRVWARLSSSHNAGLTT